MSTRVLIFLMQLHGQQLLSHKSTKLVLESLRDVGRKSLKLQRDLIGFNRTTMNYLLNEWKLAHSDVFGSEQEKLMESISKIQKRKVG